MIDIRRVFSTSFAMLRQRFWLLVGMWVVFFAIQMAASSVLGVGMVVMGAAGATSLEAGLQDPAAFAGMGVGFVIFMVLFYAAYLAIVLAQQASMVTLSSPLEQPAFGAALVRGFKSVLPFIGLMLILILGYMAMSLVFVLIAAALSVTGETTAGIFAVVLALLFLPVLIYLGCRLSVVIAVVAVDEVHNPITALRRTWAVTKGKVLGILLVLIGTLLLAFVVLGLPILLFFGSAIGAEGDSLAAVGGAVFAVLLLIPLFIIYSVFSSAIISALHAEVTDGGAEKLEDVFA
jgi:membrane-anchored glycerophosphoryl diester phosphodiesterase (GDPDase)